MVSLTVARAYCCYGPDLQPSLATDAKTLRKKSVGKFQGDLTVTIASNATFKRQGPIWNVTYGGQTFGLPHVRGLTDLHELLLHPGREFHVRTLDSLGSDAPNARVTDSVAERTAGVHVVAGLGDAGELLDDRARSAYRDRVVELRTEIDDADQCHDLGRAERLRMELEAVEDELRSTLDRSGRSRRAKSDVDRRRVAVTKRIRSAIARISKACPALAEHLNASVRTGVY